MLHRFVSASLLSLPLLFTVACNEVETGEMGLVEFVPDDCGQGSCDLDDGLAVGATTDIYLNAARGGDVDDLHIETSDPWIAEVIADEGGVSPRSVIGGNEEGLVDILAVDAWGNAIDWVTIEVLAADELEVDVQSLDSAPLDGPHPADGVDDLYFAQTGALVEIDTRALAFGSPLMGRIQYQVVTDIDMAAGIGDQDVGDGQFEIRLPPGEHDLFLSNATTWRTLHFSVQ
jgi:hypothetical protein